MDKYLFGDNNLNQLTLYLIKIMNFKNDQKIFIDCRQLIFDEMKKVYSKYYKNLPQSQESIDKLNKKTLSNCINKFKIFEDRRNGKCFKNPNNNQPSTQQPIQSQPMQSQTNPMINHGNYNPNIKPATSKSSTGDYALLSEIPQMGIFNATGHAGIIADPRYNNDKDVGKKDFMSTLQYRQELMKQERDGLNAQLMPNNQPNQITPEVMAFLNISNSPNIPQQNYQQPPQQNYQQSPPNYQQQHPQQNSNSYTGNSNMGSSFDEAYSGRKLSDTQQNYINESDPNTRLSMLKASRSEIDDEAKKYQSGKGFDPTQSPFENNKKILSELDKNNNNFFF